MVVVAVDVDGAVGAFACAKNARERLEVYRAAGWNGCLLSWAGAAAPGDSVFAVFYTGSCHLAFVGGRAEAERALCALGDLADQDIEFGEMVVGDLIARRQAELDLDFLPQDPTNAKALDEFKLLLIGDNEPPPLRAVDYFGSAPYTLDDEPVEEPAAEPVAEPAAEPVAEPVAEPAAEPVAEPAAEPVAEPAAEPVEELVEELAAEPVAEPAAEPVEELAAEPVKELAAEPVEELAAEPVAEPAAEPVAEPASDATESSYRSTDSVSSESSEESFAEPED